MEAEAAIFLLAALPLGNSRFRSPGGNFSSRRVNPVV